MSPFQSDHIFGILAAVAVLFPRSAALGEAAARAAEHSESPHANPSLCGACHLSTEGEHPPLRWGCNISQLCRSCHDGRLAPREVHPVGMVPSDAVAARMGAAFPRSQGVLTCLTCHTVLEQCKGEEGTPPHGPHLLRGKVDSHNLTYCLQCHVEENYRPFNVHDQIDDAGLKTDTCAWCHAGVQAGKAPLQRGTSYPLHNNASKICGNCHALAKGHPAGKPHLYVAPSDETKWYISAWEIRPRMQVPIKELTAYVRAAGRAPRSIPLDEQGRITCATCHNPHEEGLLAKGGDRSLGAEPKHAKNHRLRAPAGKMCLTCHDR